MHRIPSAFGVSVGGHEFPQRLASGPLRADTADTQWTAASSGSGDPPLEGMVVPPVKGRTLMSVIDIICLSKIHYLLFRHPFNLITSRYPPL